MIKFYDCHTHLNYEPLSKNADHVALICSRLNITINNIGTNLDSSIEAINLAKRYDNVMATVGVHPNDTNKHSIGEVIRKLEE
jgi:TatD DNase family protein